MLKALLIALAIVTIVYLVVAKTRIGDIGFKPVPDGQPDVVMGVVAIVLSLTLMAVVVFVPKREGAPPSASYYLQAYALSGLGWGLGQLRRSKTRRRKASTRTNAV